MFSDVSPWRIPHSKCWPVEGADTGRVLRNLRGWSRWQKTCVDSLQTLHERLTQAHHRTERECSNSWKKSMQTLKTFIILFIRLTLICQNMGYFPFPSLPSQRATRSSIRPSSWESRVQRTSPQEVCFVSWETPPVWFIIGRCDSHYSTWSDCACVRYVWYVYETCIYVSMYRCICVSMSLCISMCLCIYASMYLCRFVGV